MLQLHVQGYLLHPELMDASSGFDNSSFWGQLRDDLKAAQWVEVLEHWGYAQSFLVQIPLLTGQETAHARAAHRELEKARSDLLDGRYRDAVAACRDALEVAYGAGDTNPSSELQYQVKNLDAANKEARFWLLRKALLSLTHAAKHNDEVTQIIQWSRRDAVAAISILSALLQQDQRT
jgi:hypothetical protein